MKKLLYLTIILGLVGCSEPPKEEPKIYRAPKKEEPTEIVEQKVVIKNVYVNEDDYTSYDVDATTSSYWYIKYETEHMKGWTVMELKTPYPDIVKFIERAKLSDGKDKKSDYAEITYFTRVPFETYKTYKESY